MLGTLLPAALTLALGAPCALPPPAAAEPRPAAVLEDVEALVAKLKSLRDAAEPELIRELAGIGTRQAMEGLLSVYDSMGSIYMKREVVRALATFGDDPDAAQPALQRIMDVATQAKERELREAAVDALAESPSLGKNFLAMVVESPADEDVRERAMEHHVAMSDESDVEWYRSLYRLQDDKDKKDKRSKKKEGENEEEDGRRLNRLRVLAFGAMAKSLDDREVEEALEDRYWGIRGAALRELHRRGDRRIEQRAREKLDYIEEHAQVRIAAAEILAELNGTKEADAFIDLGTGNITPLQVRLALADLLAGFGDDRVDQKLRKLVGRGKEDEKLFAIRAARRIEDDKLDKVYRKLLKDKEDSVKFATLEVLAEREDVGALEDVEKLVEKAKDPELLAAGLDTISALRGADAAWIEQLRAYAGSDEPEIRNAALLQLGKLQPRKHLALLTERLSSEEWSTRLAALRGLEAGRDKAAVGPIIDRMEHETGRMQLEFAEALWRLTGQPFRLAVGSWKAWWQNEGDAFEVISAAELAQREAEEEERRLKMVSGTDFFGIRIVSHRVIFIIDVSGSMNEPTAGRYSGEAGDARIEVAKRELEKCIDGLDRSALFNIFIFSSGVDSWLDEGIRGSDQKSRDEAKAYVHKLGAGGATNLHDALQTAFGDPDVDTIFVLSDGEPTAGAKIDPLAIRDAVRRWNDHRDIVINTIAVGGELQILEWLAEDTGGSHVKFR